MAKRRTLAEQIRRAAIDSGMTAYRIAKETGISEPTVGRFMRGETTFSLDNAEKVMDLLGFRVMPPSKVDDSVNARVSSPRRTKR